MDERTLVLIQQIQRDADSIAVIYAALDRHPLRPDSDNDTLIVIAYHLHNLYNAFENIFQNIAAFFENSVEDKGRWHSQLLERMCLDVMPLRPAVIDAVAYDALDELRRFRHLFRHAYGIELDPLRLQLVMTKATVLRTVYGEQVDAFVGFLRRLG